LYNYSEINTQSQKFYIIAHNVWPSSGGILSFCSLDINVLPLYMYNKGQ